ncbi:MAG: site-specific integrase [Pseudoflavonifractor sp.]
MARKTIERNISLDEERHLYYVYLDQGRDEAGKRMRQYRTAPSLAAARKLLRSFRADLDAHRTVAPRSMTLDQWLDYWMEQVILPNRAETTIYGYRKIIQNHLSPALGSIPIQALTPQHLQQYYSRLMRENHLAANTVRRHHDLLSAALHMALRQDVLLRCPTERVEPPHVIPHETCFYGPEELKRLFALTEGTWLELFVKLAGGLGLRREEICGLRWTSVDFSRQRLRVCEARTAAGALIVQKETKNRSSTRTLHMDEALCRLLRRERARQAERKLALGSAYVDSGMVAVDPSGKPYSPNMVSLAFTRFITAQHLPKITLHGLRHTFATLASAQGAPLFDIGKALGHSTPATTGRIYTHLLDQTHEATLDRVAAALK